MSFATSAPLPTLLFAAFSALAVAGCGVSVSLGDEATTRIETEFVDSDGVRALVVDTGNGAVVVHGGSSDRIEIEATMREEKDGAASFSVTRTDSRVVVDGDCDNRAWEECEVGFEISVPADIDVVAETDNGAVTIDRIRGEVDATTDNGAIDAVVLSGDRVRARTDNGRIELGFEQPPSDVDAESDNGAILIRLPDTSYEVDADSDNGEIDIEVATAPDADRTVRAHSDNGSIRIERS